MSTVLLVALPASAAAEPLVPDPGDVTVDGNFRFSSARVFSVWLPGNMFHPLDSSATPAYLRTADGYGRPAPSGTVTLVAPVQFPNNASLFNMTCYYYDNTSGPDFNLISGTVRLYDRRFSAPTGRQLAEVQFNSSLFAPSETVHSVGTSSFDPSEIDQFNRAYYLWASITTNLSGPTLRFYGCVIDYQMTTVNP